MTTSCTGLAGLSKEPLNKSSIFPKLRIKCAEQREESGTHEAEDTGDHERIRAVQQEDPAVEEALYDSAVMRRSAGIDLGNEPVPDETTVCKFPHLLERNDLGTGIFGR